jgi:hypothetical protein
MAAIPYEQLVEGQRYLITLLETGKDGVLKPRVDYKNLVLQDIPGTLIKKERGPFPWEKELTFIFDGDKGPTYANKESLIFKSLNERSLAAIESVGKAMNQDTTARNSPMGTILDYAGLPKQPLPRRIGPLRPNGTFGGKRHRSKRRKTRKNGKKIHKK